ncbi:hypothetical protein D3C86_1992270 [compost metagenome]
MARAEIVDLDVDAELLDAFDIRGDDVVAFIEEDRFHQLEGNLPRHDAQAV